MGFPGPTRAALVTVLSLLGWGTRVLQTAHCRQELLILTDAAVTAFVEFLMSFIKGLRCYKQVVV